MKRKIGSMGLSLVAVLLLGGIATASASAAEPEFTTKTGGAVAFTAEGGRGLLATVKGRVVECKSSEGTGEVKPGREKAIAKLAVHFKHCKAQIPGEEGVEVLPCKSEGAANGEIVTNAIVGKPVWTPTGTTEVGIELEPETAGGLFAKFRCAGSVGGKAVGVTVEVKGSVIGEVPTTQLNKETTELMIEFHQAAGVQAPSEYEEAGVCHSNQYLESKGSEGEPTFFEFPFERSAIQEVVPGTTVTKAAAAVELKAEVPHVGTACL